jgi:hypothetical protein
MISSISPASLLAGVAETRLAALKQSNDVARQEGEAMIQLLESSLSEIHEHLLDTYAPSGVCPSLESRTFDDPFFESL